MWVLLLSLLLSISPSLSHKELVWDEQGYILYCPCMGRFGNQAAHFLGALAFAKRLNRTLTLPPWRTYVRQRNVPFKEWFRTDVVGIYHKSLPLEQFLETFSDRWPAGNRTGYCYGALKNADDCGMKKGNPFGPFWTELGVNFNRSEFTGLSYDTESQHLMQQWLDRYPASSHPVLAFKGAPASFPVKKHHRSLQAFLIWSDNILNKVRDYRLNVMNGKEYIGIHLRIGSDWSIACQHATGTRSFMESLQCLESDPKGVITNDICLPSIERIISDIKIIMKETELTTIFVASDKEPPLKELKNGLGSKVEIFYMKPDLPQVDLAMLGQSRHFIGNCVSSFSAFVKRERDLNSFPTSFWGQIKTIKEEL